MGKSVDDDGRRRKKVKGLLRDGFSAVREENYVEAVEHFDDALKLIEESDDGEYTLAILLNKAACTLAMMKYRDTSLICTRILAMEPKCEKALYRRAKAYSELNLLEQAKADLSRLCEINDDENVSLMLSLVKAELKSPQWLSLSFKGPPRTDEQNKEWRAYVKERNKGQVQHGVESKRRRKKKKKQDGSSRTIDHRSRRTRSNESHDHIRKIERVKSMGEVETPPESNATRFTRNRSSKHRRIKFKIDERKDDLISKDKVERDDGGNNGNDGDDDDDDDDDDDEVREDDGGGGNRDDDDDDGGEDKTVVEEDQKPGIVRPLLRPLMSAPPSIMRRQDSNHEKPKMPKYQTRIPTMDMGDLIAMAKNENKDLVAQASAQIETASRVKSSPRRLEEPYMVRAKADFSGETAKQISFGCGDVLTVIREDDSGWWKGRTKDGSKGWFPQAYVEPIDVNKLG